MRMEKLHDENQVGGSCNTHKNIRNVYKILVGKHEGNRLLRIP
jgi:hypothetical protein